MNRPRRLATALAAPLAFALVASASVAVAQSPSSAPASGAPASAAPAQLTPLTVGLGYIPNVQFAQFYLAQQAGYYRDAGLDVTFQNQVDPELITLIGQGAVDIGMGDGTSVIPARSQGIPVRYAATIYAKFPAVVYAKASSGITTAADLKGRSLGTPGKYGSSWIMLQALLSSAGLTPDDLNVTLYPDYGQGVAVATGQVDAATGFANNEPVQLALQGETPVILTVDDVVPLPGPGLVVGDATLAAKGPALKAFVGATLRAMADIKADPQKGLDATFAMVPDLAADPTTQRAVLDATIAGWTNAYTDTAGLGAIDPAAWQKSVDYLTSMPGSPVAPGAAVAVSDLITTDLLPTAP